MIFVGIFLAFLYYHLAPAIDASMFAGLGNVFKK
jgi:hypothetical protein